MVTLTEMDVLAIPVAQAETAYKDPATQMLATMCFGLDIALTAPDVAKRMASTAREILGLPDDPGTLAKTAALITSLYMVSDFESKESVKAD